MSNSGKSRIFCFVLFWRNGGFLEYILAEQATDHEIIIYWIRGAILAPTYCGLKHFNGFMNLVQLGRVLEANCAPLLFNHHPEFIAHSLVSMTCSRSSSNGVGHRTGCNPQLASLKTSQTSYPSYFYSLSDKVL